MVKKRGLGRGLDALLGASAADPVEISTVANTSNDAPSDSGAHETSVPSDGTLRNLPIEYMQRGRYQPRRDMQPEALEELANSIRSQGIMQPIVVRPIDTDRYEIIAGERRWRASQLAGLDSVPALIRDVPDEAAAAMALIENLQREDLNPMEEALAMVRLQKEFELTHAEIAQLVGKSRTTITNLLRLTGLREEVQKLLENGDIEMGHARALLGVAQEQQSSAASTVVSKGLSVRQTEALVRRLAEENTADKSKKAMTLDPDVKQLQESLSEKLGSPVTIQYTAKGRGTLTVKYSNLEELDGILKHIK
ncbi:putative chromosome-partitioning protein ParB [Zhongshania aliphaticivorans]|uniref:Probable chromosome-partitioning protein ParB n=1 Tax=Zhongshania aliphaticivorans TaxID=1470434 RepID=A0A5S9PKC5_9GAMM|nr:ParB/RepB/Spo0J family partition protein [Zhongshania aliphaticivorans]CAA0104340.1 putative chromosome-partitioning protein ParB [Zhongshania aliphaticivorans]CAA0104567.1 putative chromosome-partitioning protein ParB [Zhongshania aliphaticivorans]